MSVGSETCPCCGGFQMLRHIRHGGYLLVLHVLTAVVPLLTGGSLNGSRQGWLARSSLET